MSWLSSIGKTIANVAGTGIKGGVQLFSGNPVGAVTTLAGGIGKQFGILKGGSSAAGTSSLPSVPRFPGFAGPSSGMVAKPQGYSGGPIPPGPSLRGSSGRGRVGMTAEGKCPSGYHPAKDGNGCVRNRHMNFGNGRATGRAIRRIHGAEKQFRHIFHMTHPGKKGGRVAFSRKRKR